jgi:predicted  nucleic acid-binding Zn-ribbon protein
MADMHRSVQARKLLHLLDAETRKAKTKLTTYREKEHVLKNEVASLEQKLQLLQNELLNKKNLVKTAEHELEELNERIKYDEEKKMGLCIR